MKQTLYLLLLFLLASSCASIRQRDDTTQLNQVFQIPRYQDLYAHTQKGSVQTKRLHRPAKAGLYQKHDTLFVEFLAETLLESDSDPKTIDQSDSSAIFFLHYNPTLNKIEEKSPWFRYQTTALDIDLFTMPFKYRFSTANQPGQLEDKLNVGVYMGGRYDLGRYRTIYFRKNHRSEISTFSVGLGGFFCISSARVDPFSTLGQVQDEYYALGVNYGVSTIISIRSFSAGLALGFEQITDRNRALWIYQHKPWLGITVGINLN
ncbi:MULTISPECIES: hypothetical protein [Spirosoma]|uniref:DUF3575 domain-containing protein n=1 Tax=Spirosoma liriopis TaxID=2937440 RepID=A0ABT0HS50_9BACT|nr:MULTISPECIES: hypothetical protein [Spirosoma]MCK8494815.1 hypothetical protein [Spirosoma liriopis]UHG93944.1 hypothetical protein LQ777_24575 [Spirosoma oryzicola]